MHVNEPVVYELDYKSQVFDHFNKDLIQADDQEVILEYPTVYIINDKASRKFNVYIGETNNVIQRTRQHMADQEKVSFLQSPSSKIYLIGHDMFNKSLTMDIENRLMHYMVALGNVKKTL
ncbi:GIY-YIG catalytic domain-containing protein [Aerococcus urinaehominis]|nr:GIY-YIG catalytic domain-containing protein [Aerococcus urinaehominis]